MTMVYTPLKPQASERETVIEWLKAHGYPALPVAPAQDPFKYSKRNKQGEIEYEKDGAMPKPLFTGKNPSYLDRNGIPHLVNHRQYQNSLPSDRQLKEWFANPANGVGTLGGWNNTVWLDFDVKQFPSQQECDAAVLKFLERNELQQTFIERSHSGGWRVGIRVKEKPEFTNFALSLGAKHIGEALGEGRFTVLAPTIGVSGNAYQSINRLLPVEVVSLESIGIYPTSTKKPMSEVRVTPQSITAYIPGSIPLEQLGTDTSREILQGGCPTGDRSEALATAAQEWYGWQNWTRENGIAVTGAPEDLANYAGRQLGIDSDRVDRILKTIDIISSNPAALHRGGEESCWKKIRRLDKATFEAKCPAHIKDGIKAEWERVNSTLPSGINFSDRDYPEAKSAQKLSLKEAVVKAREVLTAESDELTANIKLEEIRQACGMGSYDWERKIIKPLKRDLESDRFKLELLGLLQIDDQVERIRQQALMAPKYQMSSSLIEKAMAAMKQRTQTPEAKALDLDELFDLESEGLSWVIPGLLPEKETIVLAGAPKAGKTLLAIDAAYSVATGESYFLGEATSRGKVLLVSTDESAKSTKAKLINRGFRRGDKDSIKVLPTWDISQMGALEALLEDFRPDLVIIDSLRRINKGSEISENSAEFADAIYTLKETLERYGASGILIHHTNKDREALGVHRLRGSSAIAGAVWGTWQLDQIPKPDPNNKKKLIIDPKDPTRTLSVFARDIEGQQLKLELNPENSSWAKLGEVGDSVEAAAERDTLQARISRLLSIPAHALGLSGSEIIERLDDADVEKRSVYNCLNRMVAKRLMTCKPAPGDKRYNIYSLPNCHTPDLSAANCHTPEISLPPPSPTPTDPDDDYYAESVTTYGVGNSHQNSHHPKKISHHPPVGNPPGDYSNADAVSDSEIVIDFAQETGGGCEETAASVTVEGVTVVGGTLAPATNDVVKVGIPVQDNCPETVLSCSELESEEAPEPDFDQFPHSNPHATWGVKKSKAQQIKREILEIDSREDYEALRNNPQYSADELNWVRRNLLTKQQRQNLTVTVQGS